MARLGALGALGALGGRCGAFPRPRSARLAGAGATAARAKVEAAGVIRRGAERRDGTARSAQANGKAVRAAAHAARAS